MSGVITKHVGEGGSRPLGEPRPPPVGRHRQCCVKESKPGTAVVQQPQGESIHPWLEMGGSIGGWRIESE